jgi:hypothetical protein
MSLCLICPGDKFVEKTFILDDKFVNYSGLYNQHADSYMVTIRNLFADGSETKTTREFSLSELNRTLTKLADIDANTGSIYRLMQTLRVNPNKYYYYGVAPTDI